MLYKNEKKCQNKASNFTMNFDYYETDLLT